MLKTADELQSKLVWLRQDGGAVKANIDVFMEMTSLFT